MNIITLAQNSEILDNLAESENKLQGLNQKANALIDEYNNTVSMPVHNSFFNFDNIYFWVVLAGLLLLAFGLLFLLAELQYPAKQPKDSCEEEKDDNGYDEKTNITYVSEAIPSKDDKTKIAETNVKKPVKKGKAIKIKVEKVK